MSEKRVVQLGVIGLGERWQQRYRPTLLRLKRRFRIAAVADQIQQQARQEAKALQCGEARGVVELLRNSAVDALLLADPQWHGLWPLTVAARYNKPVFCGVPPKESKEAHPTDAVVMVDLPLRRSPLLAALREICAAQLGPVRLLLCTLTEPRRPLTPASESLGLFPADYLDACLHLLEGEPRRVLANGLTDGMLTNLLMELTDGSAVQINRCVAGAKPSCRLEVFGENGTAAAVIPNRLRWSNKQGKWSRIIPAGKDPLRQLLRAFYRVVTTQKEPSPDLQDATRVWKWQRLALQSLKRGEWVFV